MSDKERLNLRELPAVDPVVFPARYSQTLLAKADKCMRSAYLYVKNNGGTPGIQLDRGTAAHAVFERMTMTLLERGETSFLEMSERDLIAQGSSIKEIAGGIASITADIVDEVLRDRPDLPLPVGEADAVRLMAYHWAVGMVIDPETVVGVERKFVMDIGGREVSGIVDLASINGDTGEVDDYKSSLNPGTQEQYESKFQGKLYGALLMFGYPVERVPCLACGGVPTEHENCCGGRGTVERRMEPIGGQLAWVQTRELFPRYLLDDGTLKDRTALLSRMQVQDFIEDVARKIAQLDEAQETWKFPARNGSHCPECPARGECPLPEHLRSFAGEINTMQQAEEAAAWADFMAANVAATEKELKAFADMHGEIRYGTDKVRRFVLQEGKSVKRVKGRAGWQELEAAVEEAAQFGTPFDLSEWVKSSSSMRFKTETLTTDELAELPVIADV